MNRIFNKSDRYSQKTLFFLCLLLISLLFSGCSLKVPENEMKVVSQTGFYLNTLIKITLYDGSSPELITDCFSLCRQYELEFSRTDPKSILYQLNHETGDIRNLL